MCDPKLPPNWDLYTFKRKKAKDYECVCDSSVSLMSGGYVCSFLGCVCHSVPKALSVSVDGCVSAHTCWSMFAFKKPFNRRSTGSSNSDNPRFKSEFRQ